MTGVAFPSTEPGGLISAFRGTAGVERHLSGSREPGGNPGGAAAPRSPPPTLQVSLLPARARGGSSRGGQEAGEPERGRSLQPPSPAVARLICRGCSAERQGQEGAAGRGAALRCAALAAEGRRGALSFHCLPVLLHRPFLCQPSEWESCLPAAPLLIRASAARACPTTAASAPIAFKCFDII